jgi:hypothetical protein
MDIDI